MRLSIRCFSVASSIFRRVICSSSSKRWVVPSSKPLLAASSSLVRLSIRCFAVASSIFRRSRSRSKSLTIFSCCFSVSDCVFVSCVSSFSWFVRRAICSSATSISWAKVSWRMSLLLSSLRCFSDSYNCRWRSTTFVDCTDDCGKTCNELFRHDASLSRTSRRPICWSLDFNSALASSSSFLCSAMTAIRPNPSWANCVSVANCSCSCLFSLWLDSSCSS